MPSERLRTSRHVKNKQVKLRLSFKNKRRCCIVKKKTTPSSNWTNNSKEFLAKFDFLLKITYITRLSYSIHYGFELYLITTGYRKTVNHKVHDQKLHQRRENMSRHRKNADLRQTNVKKTYCKIKIPMSSTWFRAQLLAKLWSVSFYVRVTCSQSYCKKQNSL